MSLTTGEELTLGTLGRQVQLVGLHASLQNAGCAGVFSWQCCGAEKKKILRCAVPKTIGAFKEYFSNKLITLITQ